jgi:hypothetical protein
VENIVISDKNIATELSQMMLKIGADLDRSVAKVQQSCSAEEFEAYRSVVGILMTTLLIEFLNPLYKAHPDLKPPELL